MHAYLDHIALGLNSILIIVLRGGFRVNTPQNPYSWFVFSRQTAMTHTLYNETLDPKPKNRLNVPSEIRQVNITFRP